MSNSGQFFASLAAAVLAGAALEHESGRRFYHKHLTEKAGRSKKRKRKQRQKSKRRNR